MPMKSPVEKETMSNFLARQGKTPPPPFSLKRRAAHALAGNGLERSLAQVAPELVGLGLALQPLPRAEAPAQLLVLGPELLADALLLLLEAAVVRLEVPGHARAEGRRRRVGLAAGDHGRHRAEEVLRERHALAALRGWAGRRVEGLGHRYGGGRRRGYGRARAGGHGAAGPGRGRRRQRGRWWCEVGTRGRSAPSAPSAHAVAAAARGAIAARARGGNGRADGICARV